MAYPSTPTSLYINGFPERPEKLTKNTDGTCVRVRDRRRPGLARQGSAGRPVQQGQDLQELLDRLTSRFGRQGVRHRTTMTGLALNTLYYVRVYTQQRDRKILSRTYRASSFWTP